jgi:hypothetical protein
LAKSREICGWSYGSVTTFDQCPSAGSLPTDFFSLLIDHIAGNHEPEGEEEEDQLEDGMAPWRGLPLESAENRIRGVAQQVAEGDDRMNSRMCFAVLSPYVSNNRAVIWASGRRLVSA